MRIIGITLTGPLDAAPGVAHAELIRDALWAHAPTCFGLEHITVTPGSAGVEIIFFINESIANPEQFAVDIFSSAASRSRFLRKWIET
jgi:hypothetical protein